MSWTKATVIGILVFAYFALTTAFLPSRLLTAAGLAAAPRQVQDAVTVLVWGAFLVGGMWGLRRAQGRGWI